MEHTARVKALESIEEASSGVSAEGRGVRAADQSGHTALLPAQELMPRCPVPEWNHSEGTSQEIPPHTPRFLPTPHFHAPTETFHPPSPAAEIPLAESGKAR